MILDFSMRKLSPVTSLVQFLNINELIKTFYGIRAGQNRQITPDLEELV